ALMNIRGDQGTDDRRSYASMGAGTRASVTTEDYINFQKVDQDWNIHHTSKIGPIHINKYDLAFFFSKTIASS
ncbi:hypothetical protein ACTPEF_27135, partial [Clostridioides difficile]